jgi:hypothetical protein
MTADFTSALRNAEGTLSVARDNMNMYEKLHKQWREEFRIAGAVLERLREAAGVPRDAPIVKVAPGPEPYNAPPAELPGWAKNTDEPKGVATTPAPLSPAAVAEQAGANGFDRTELRRQLRHWHVKYPMAKSYKSPGQLARQALRALIIDHPDYNDKWLDKGHADLTDANVSIPVEVLENAGKVVGIEYEPVRKAAYRLQRNVELYGTPGVDYLWEAF